MNRMDKKSNWVTQVRERIIKKLILKRKLTKLFFCSRK